MENMVIIVVDDQPEILTSVSRDLEALAEFVQIEECESGDEVLELLEEIDARGDLPAVIISDQVMPGKSGVELLTELCNEPRFRNSKRILLTGLATQEDTIEAINHARIDRYIEKPWDQEKLLQATRECLTLYVLEQGLDVSDLQPVLDSAIVLQHAREQV